MTAMKAANDNGPLGWPFDEAGTYISRGDDLVQKKVVVDGTVYVIEFQRWIKIGFTRNLKYRLRSLQCGLPTPLSLVAKFHGCEQDEMAFLEWFAPDSTGYGEWFNRSGSIAAWINGGCDQSVFEHAITFDGFNEAVARNAA